MMQALGISKILPLGLGWDLKQRQLPSLWGATSGKGNYLLDLSSFPAEMLSRSAKAPFFSLAHSGLRVVSPWSLTVSKLQHASTAFDREL